MPAPIEIPDPVVVVRELQDDEKLVVSDFERHASHCATCANATQTHKDGRTLCTKGTAYARALSNYLYANNGKHYSTVDYESGKSTRVNLPHDLYAVRNLLVALEQGLRIRQKPLVVQPVQPVQPASYDRTYPIPARRASDLRPRSMSPDTYQIIERAPRLSRSPTSIMYRSPGGSPSRPTSSRGSLYDSDRQERVERRTRTETNRRYIEASKYYR